MKTKIVFNDYEPNEVIRIIREWTTLTQAEFGKSINKSLRTVQDYEAGKIIYNIEILKQICKKHNIKITIEKDSINSNSYIIANEKTKNKNK